MADYLGPAGARINTETGEFLDKERLKKEKKASLLAKEEEEGPSPIAMGLLQLGASMMRDEGWKDRPVTLGESIGKAIPYGIAGYYNQDERNQVNRANLLAERQATKQQELLEGKTLTDEAEKKRTIASFVEYVDGLDDSIFNIPDSRDKQGRIDRRKKALVEQFLKDPNGAYNRIDSMRDKQEDRGKPTTGDIEAAVHLRNSKDEYVEQVEKNPDLTKAQKDNFTAKYKWRKGNTMNSLQLNKMVEDFSGLMGSVTDKSERRSQNNSYIDALKKRYFLGEEEGFDLTSDNLAELEQIMKGITDPEKQYEALEKLNEKIATQKMPTDQVMSISGEQLLKDHGDKFKGVNKDLTYNVTKNPDGTIQIISGTDYTAEELDHTTEKANSYIKLLDSLQVIGPQQSAQYKELALTDPKRAMADLTQVMGKSLASTLDDDPNEGKVMTSDEIKKATKGKIDYRKGNTLFYWDTGKGTWKEVDDKAFDRGAKLSTQYNMQAKLYTQSLNAYNGLVAAFKDSKDNPKGAGVSDMTILRAFMIMLEPNSVVRESEFATAAKAQGMRENLSRMIDYVKSGAFLSEEGRQSYLRAARSYMVTVKDQYDLQREHYVKMAKTYDIPESILLDTFAGVKGLDMTAEDRKELTQKEWDQLWKGDAVDWQHGRKPDAPLKDAGPLKFGAGNE